MILSTTTVATTQASITQQAKEAYNSLVGGSTSTANSTTATGSANSSLLTTTSANITASDGWPHNHGESNDDVFATSKQQQFTYRDFSNVKSSQHSMWSSSKSVSRDEQLLSNSSSQKCDLDVTAKTGSCSLPSTTSPMSSTTSSPPPPLPPHSHSSIPLADKSFQSKQTESNASSGSSDQQHNNPLRMLRAGVTVRPKVRGNKHNFPLTSGFSTVDRNSGIAGGLNNRPMSSYRDGSSGIGSSNAGLGNVDIGGNQTLPKGFKTKRHPPAVAPKPTNRVPEPGAIIDISEECFTSQTSSDRRDSQCSQLSTDSIGTNPLPLPPRDRTRLSQNYSKPRHQRKHPLIMPSVLTNSILRTLPPGTTNSCDKTESSNNNSSPSRLVIQHTHNPQLDSSNICKLPGLIDAGPGASLSTHSSSSSSIVDRGSQEGFDELDTGEGLLSMMGLSSDGSMQFSGKFHTGSDEEDCDGGGVRDEAKMPPAKPPRLFR